LPGELVGAEEERDEAGQAATVEEGRFPVKPQFEMSRLVSCCRWPSQAGTGPGTVARVLGSAGWHFVITVVGRTVREVEVRELWKSVSPSVGEPTLSVQSIASQDERLQIWEQPERCGGGPYN